MLDTLEKGKIYTELLNTVQVLDTLEKGKIYTELLNTHNYSKYCPGARHVRKR